MKRRYLTSSLVAFLLLTFFASSAVGQNLRPEETFYVTPRVGLADYTGDRDPSSIFSNDLGVEGRFPWLGGVEIGYQFSSSTALAVAYEVGNFTTIAPGMEDDGYTRRHIGQLLLRYTFGADSWRVAPFLDVGGFLARGYTDQDDNQPLGYGPTVGLGLDFALNDRTSLFLRAETNLSIPDSNVDGAEDNPVNNAGRWYPPSGSPAFNGNEDLFLADGVELEEPTDDADFLGGFDGLNSVQLGLKFNFKSAFTDVDVMSLDCPAEPLEVGETATFTAMTNDAEATRPVSYRWDFGSAGQAQGLVVTRSFNEAGTYTVSFTADNEGSSESMTCTVVVEEPPVAAEVISIDADPDRFEVCEPQTVRFTANVRGDEPVEYSWNFGDGSTGRGPNPTHVYETPGTYTVTLEVTNETGTDTRSMTITAEECIPEICRDVSEMNPVFFGRNSSTLTAEARAALRENLELFAECPNLCARIEGYAAPGERNAQELSEDRARAVEQFYIDNGIAASRFETIGRGQVGGTTSKKEGASQYRRATTTPMECDMM